MFFSSDINSMSLALSICAPLLVFSLVVMLFLKKKRTRRRTQNQGIDVISQICKLIKMIQQHRGLSYGYLRGDESLKNNLFTIESNIQSHVKKQTFDFSSSETKDRWAGFSEHWKKLSLNNLQVTPENNLEQHNLMIANLIFLVEDVAAISHLQDSDFHQGGKNGESISALWRNILRTAEWVGQARALGTGIAASGQCSSVERIRIKFIRGKIQSHSDALKVFFNTSSIKRGKNHSQVLVHLNKFMNTMDDRLIAPPSPTVSSSEYFALATTAIDAFIAFFDEKLAEYAQQIQNSQAETSNTDATYSLGTTARA